MGPERVGGAGCLPGSAEEALRRYSKREGALGTKILRFEKALKVGNPEKGAPD